MCYCRMFGPTAVPVKVMVICPETISRHMKEKIVIGNIKNGLIKAKSYVTSLVVLYDEKFSSGNKRKAVMLFTLTLARLLT